MLVHRCAGCDRWIYPAAPRCTACGGESVEMVVRGDGIVFTYTVAHHPYRPVIPVPYVIALVELDEAPGLRIAATVVGYDPERVRIGMPVSARNETRDGITATVFVPRVPDTD